MEEILVREIKTVTIVGANGTMGRNVAAIYAAFGGCTVYLVCRDINKAKATVAKSVLSVRADSIASRLIPADYAMLDECVAKSDIVVEHIKEELGAKVELMQKIGKVMPSHAIACSGSSGLSITTLAECFPDNLRSHFFGVHMFNPPYAMTLCELIPTRYSDMGLFADLKDYLSNILLRTVVVVKDSPAFLGNRIGFQFINEALQYAEKYKDNGGIDYVDAILGAYTGRTMAPITTADFVGLDIHKAIVDNIYANTNDFSHKSFICPGYINKLVEKGMFGRKSGGGLYYLKKFDSGVKQMYVYDIASDSYREANKYVFPFAETMIRKLRKGSYKSAFQALIDNHSQEAEMCLHFLLKYVIYSIAASEEVGFSVRDADDVMAAGFNWCPPMAVVDAILEETDFKELVKERLELGSVEVDHLLSLIEPSKYDFRIYFKAKK